MVVSFLKSRPCFLQTLRENSSTPGNLAVWVGDYCLSSWASESFGSMLASHFFASLTSS